MGDLGMYDFREWRHVFKLDPNKEITDEVKRIVSLMPNYAPAFCGKAKVPYIMEFTIGVEFLKKSQQ